MDDTRSVDLTGKKQLRLWPGVVAVVLQWVGLFGVPFVFPEAVIPGVIGAGVSTLALIIWWVLLSRVPHPERWGGLTLVVLTIMVASRLLHESVASGNLGVQYYLYAIPVLSLALVCWAILSSRLTPAVSRLLLVIAIVAAGGMWTLLRSDGITSDGGAEFTWRWAETSEQRLLAAQRDDPSAAASSITGTGTTGRDWPGFRGSRRDGIVTGVKIETDWSVSPPVEIWRRPVGPAASSFAVRGNLVYTHEQRGEDEVASCYNLNSGEVVWMYRDAIRFWDSHVGAGPRATPALAVDHLYTFGGTGVLNALNAADGSLVWSRDVAAETNPQLPPPNAWYGFVSSPLVVDDLVIVYTNALSAYDRASGERRWVGSKNSLSYSSPHLVEIDGICQVLMVSSGKLTSVAPADGSKFWEHPLDGWSIIQPVLTPENDLLIGLMADGAVPLATIRLAVRHGSSGWRIEELWTTTRLKPAFNQIVLHKGHAFGIDGRILASIDLQDGSRNWKGGRYGSGQVLGLPDQDLLLVLSEEGEVVLVEATPASFKELGRFQAIEGKTWNNPVLVGEILLVRNREEMAAFRLSRLK